MESEFYRRNGGNIYEHMGDDKSIDRGKIRF